MSQRYEVNPTRDAHGEWSLYNIWDSLEARTIPICWVHDDNGPISSFTRDRAYAERICREMNERDEITPEHMDQLTTAALADIDRTIATLLQLQAVYKKTHRPSAPDLLADLKALSDVRLRLKAYTFLKYDITKKG